MLDTSSIRNKFVFALFLTWFEYYADYQEKNFPKYQNHGLNIHYTPFMLVESRSGMASLRGTGEKDP